MIAYLWRYISGVFIAVPVSGILALIFKLLLITVQSPTMIPQLCDVVGFYVVLSVAYFFLFRNYGMKQSSRNIKKIPLYVITMVALHTIIVASVDSWSGIWFISMGTLTFVKLIYIGVDEILRLITYSEISRMYYNIAVAIEDVCFIFFHYLGILSVFIK